jgi:glycosyltransferase involved in cell wall biosynthesis
VRIAVVGPAPPDRGGIAQQTRLLAESLGADLSGYFGYSRRYPRWLDPRRFDIPPGSAGEALPASERRIDCFDYARPASWRKTARAVLDAGSEALIIPWWTAFWALPVRALIREVRKLDRRIPAVLLCHNVVEHETAFWKRLLAGGALEAADAFIVHSEEDRRDLGRRFPGRPALSLPHAVEDRPRPDREASRRKLGVARPLVLFLGLVRRYKGVDLLLDAARSIFQGSEAEIAVVGEVFPDAEFIPERARHHPQASRIRLVDRYVAETELDEWLAACDVVVCPYRRVSGSGIASRAIAARRPIVASDLEGFRTLVTAEAGILFQPGDAGALARAVLSVLEKGTAPFQSGLERLGQRYSWRNYAEQVRGFCRRLRDESATIAR